MNGKNTIRPSASTRCTAKRSSPRSFSASRACGAVAIRSFVFTLLLFGALQTAFAQARMDPVTVEVTNRVILESPTRLGINIGPNAYYGDRQMVARPFAHGAFNWGQQVGFLRVGQTRVNAFQDERFRPGDLATAYRTSFQGGRYVIATGTHSGEAATIASHDVAAGLFTVGGSDPVPAVGDYVWLRGPATSHAIPSPMPGERELGIGDFRVEATPDSDVAVVDAEGVESGQAVRMQISGKDAYAALKHYVIALPSNDYRVRVRARSDDGQGDIGVRMTNFGIPSGQPGHRIAMTCDDPSLTTSWRTYEFTASTFDDQRIRDRFSAVEVRISGTRGVESVTALVESVALIDVSLDTNFAFTSRLAETLTEARCGVLRFYGIASPGSLVADITAASAERSGWTFTDGPAGFQRHTTHAVVDDWLKLSDAVGAEPWITVGGANTPEDWYQLISYLAAPASFDDASQRRASHGHVAPWTESFGTVYLELGNEWWNGIFTPFVIDDPERYADLCNTIFERVRTHPHFDANRIKLIIGGWAVNAHDWNVRLNRASKHHDVISVAPYLAHALDTVDYGAVFADVEGSFETGGRATVRGIGGSRLAVYELNTHTTGGRVTPADVSRIAPSLGAGVAVLDQAMSNMTNWRANPINYFTYFQRGFGSGNRERVGLWGNLVLGRDGSHRPRPVWQSLRLANQYTIDGDLVETQVRGGSSWDQAKNGSVPALTGLPYVKAYSFLRDAESANVLLINRHVTKPVPVRVRLPFAPKTRVVRAQLAGIAVDDNNEEYERVQLKEDELDWSAVDGVVELPPHSATALQFTAAE